MIGKGYLSILVFVSILTTIALSSCATISPKDMRMARVFLDTAKANLVNGQFVEAELEARKAIERNPKSAEAYRVLSLAYYGQQKMRNAIFEINRALKLDPKNGDYRNDLGGYYLADQRYLEARKEFQLALDDRSFMAPAAAIYNIGETYRLAGEEQTAVRKYNESLERDPNQDRPYFRLGEFALRQGKVDEAIKHMSDAIKINPYNFDALKELCFIHCEQGFKKGVDETCVKFIEITPKDVVDEQVIARIRQCINDVR